MQPNLYPILTNTVRDVLYDNSMVDAGTTETEAMAHAMGAVLLKFTPEVLQRVEDELIYMGTDRRQEVAVGEGGGEQWCSTELDAVLNWAFEQTE